MFAYVLGVQFCKFKATQSGWGHKKIGDFILAS